MCIGFRHRGWGCPLRLSWLCWHGEPQMSLSKPESCGLFLSQLSEGGIAGEVTGFRDEDVVVVIQHRAETF